MSGTGWPRRDVLKLAGLAAGTAWWTPPARAAGGDDVALPEVPADAYEWKKPARPVTAVILGAGGRGHVYAAYAARAPDEWRIVGVAEPIRARNDGMAAAHGIPEENRFATWQHVFDRPRFADVCVITMPDHLHHQPALAALEAGYDVLLEKAIAPSWRQCEDILAAARRAGRIVGVCHVLRYTPYFRQMKRVVESGLLGGVVSIQHLEPVEHLHMAHSFVRGNWSHAGRATPMLLSKSCHDLDILCWLVGRPCRKVQSFGGLALFRRERAPEGATDRCTDGCAAEATCPFSAVTIYQRRKSWLGHKDTPGQDDASILAWLTRSPYGRCVFRHDNDVVDHQVVNLEFDGGATVAFSMEGLTSYAGRRTRICGTAGDLVGDEATLEVFPFATRKRLAWSASQAASGHGGGDHGLMRDFVQAISRRDERLLSSTLADSMQSHRVGFAAEESRAEGGTLKRLAEAGAS